MTNIMNSDSDSPYSSEKKSAIIKSKFSQEEDDLLKTLVEKSSDLDWFSISCHFDNRNARQCRERWYNYLDPSLTKGQWSEEEDRILLEKYQEVGTHWNAISRFLHGRSGNSVRNRFLMIQRRIAKTQRLEQKKKRKQINPKSAQYILEENISRKNTSNTKSLFDDLFPLKSLHDIFNENESELAF